MEKAEKETAGGAAIGIHHGTTESVDGTNKKEKARRANRKPRRARGEKAKGQRAWRCRPADLGGDPTEDFTCQSGLEQLLNGPKTLKELGLCFWWLILQAGRKDRTNGFDIFPEGIKSALRAACQSLQVPRSRRALFPLPEPGVAVLSRFPAFGSIGEVLDNVAVTIWTWFGALFCNILHDNKFVWAEGTPTGPQKDLLQQIEAGVARVLNEDTSVPGSLAEVSKELSKKQLSHTGEELSRPEELVPGQILPTLPSVDHGGQVPVVDWVSDS